MNCSACDKTMRRGSTSTVYVNDGSTVLRRARVCAACARRSVSIVGLLTELKPAEQLDESERDTRAVLRALAKHFRGLAKAQRRFFAGVAQGLDQAADVTDAWAARPQARSSR